MIMGHYYILMHKGT